MTSAMTDSVVFIEGEYVSPQDARMSIFDMGFTWGDAVYDVTSTLGGWFFMLDRHLDRFEQSSAGFRLENPYSRDQVRRICAECVDRAGLEDAYIKMQLTRGVIPGGSQDPRLGDPQFVAFAVPYVWIWGEEMCRVPLSYTISVCYAVAVAQRRRGWSRRRPGRATSRSSVAGLSAAQGLPSGEAWVSKASSARSARRVAMARMAGEGSASAPAMRRNARRNIVPPGRAPSSALARQAL